MGVVPPIIPEIPNGISSSITFAWTAAGQKFTRTLNAVDSTIEPGFIRIGRDPNQCDLVLPSLTERDRTVSRCHVEIAFDTNEFGFYLSNLKPHNPVHVGGQVVTQPVILTPGCIVQLGEVVLMVEDITAVPQTVLVKPPSEQETIMFNPPTPEEPSPTQEKSLPIPVIPPMPEPAPLWRPFLYGAIVLVFGVVGIYSYSRVRASSQNSPPDLADPPVEVPATVKVTALGRIEPQGEVIRLAAPAAFRGGVSRIKELLVDEGDWVEAGQVVAILDEHDSRLADLAYAREQVKLANVRLEKVREGAQEGEISAQKATIARLEAELKNAEVEYSRYQSLHESGAISTSFLDERRLLVDTLIEQIIEARSTLDRISEVRPIDVQVAVQEVENAIATVEQAQAALELTKVRAPHDSQILKIYTRPGEVVGQSGIADIGQTNQMFVVAEVYQTDIRKVEEGQSATITGDALDGELNGTVTQIGWQVDQQDIFSVNPGVDTDRKIVEVKILIEDSLESQRISSLTNLQVEVAIDV